MPTPSRSFIRELKLIDRKLDVKWNPHICRFIVYHRDIHGRIYPVLKIQYRDGSFKPLDQRTLRSLRYSNYLRGEKPQDLLYRIDRENAELEDKKKKSLRDDAKSIAGEIPHSDAAIKEWGGRF